jgi:hypothetical protein
LTSGTPGRIRTFDQKIKSLLLYQLSYGGKFEGAKNNKFEEMRKLLFDGKAEGDTIAAADPTTSWCNGNTGDSESLIQGSSPCEVTTLFPGVATKVASDTGA